MPTLESLLLVPLIELMAQVDRSIGERVSFAVSLPPHVFDRLMMEVCDPEHVREMQAMGATVDTFTLRGVTFETERT